MDFLERLRQKSSQVKSQYAFLGALVLTSLVGTIWVTTLPARFASLGSTLESVETPQKAEVGNSVDTLITDLRNTLAPEETPMADEGDIDFSFMNDERPPVSGTTSATTAPPNDKPIYIKTVTGATTTRGNGTSTRTILIGTTTTKTQ